MFDRWLEGVGRVFDRVMLVFVVVVGLLCGLAMVDLFLGSLVVAGLYAAGERFEGEGLGSVAWLGLPATGWGLAATGLAGLRAARMREGFSGKGRINGP